MIKKRKIGVWGILLVAGITLVSCNNNIPCPAYAKHSEATIGKTNV